MKTEILYKLAGEHLYSAYLFCVYWLFSLFYFESHRIKDKAEHNRPSLLKGGWEQRQPHRSSVRSLLESCRLIGFPMERLLWPFPHTWRKSYLLHCHLCEIELFDDNTAVRKQVTFALLSGSWGSTVLSQGCEWCHWKERLVKEKPAQNSGPRPHPRQQEDIPCGDEAQLGWVTPRALGPCRDGRCWQPPGNQTVV